MTNKNSPRKPINLQLPLKHIYVTQPFSVNFVNFYKELGLRGH